MSVLFRYFYLSTTNLYESSSLLLSFSAFLKHIQFLNFIPSLYEKYILNKYGRFEVNFPFLLLYPSKSEIYIAQGLIYPKAISANMLKLKVSLWSTSYVYHFVDSEVASFVSFRIWFSRSCPFRVWNEFFTYCCLNITEKLRHVYTKNSNVRKSLFSFVRLISQLQNYL